MTSATPRATRRSARKGIGFAGGSEFVPARAEVSDHADEKHSLARSAPPRGSLRRTRYHHDDRDHLSGPLRPPARASDGSILSFPLLDREPGPAGRRWPRSPVRVTPSGPTCAECCSPSRDRRPLDPDRAARDPRRPAHPRRLPRRRALIGFFARHRSDGLTDASLVGSIMAGGVVLPIVAGVRPGVAAVFKWRVAGFLLFALAVESGVVSRRRPSSSTGPPGRAPAREAAGERELSVRAYGCLDRRLLRHRAPSDLAAQNAPERVAIWSVAVAIPIFVAFARMYRGMHHPLDVLGGVMIGVAAVAALVLVCRAAGIAARRRGADTDDEGRGVAHAARPSATGCPGSAARSSARASPTRSGSRCRRASKAPKQVKRALDGRRRADLRLGRRRARPALPRRDGRHRVALAIVPAGTANLLATNLGIPQDIEQAVAIGLRESGAGSTSAGSTASASASWRAPDSTRR